MAEGAELLRSLAGRTATEVPFHPAPEQYRRELLFFFDLFTRLSGESADYDALRQRYWRRVYAIYDRLPQHVDPRPHAATDRLVNHFRAWA
jgi:hypothetical protein